jgi:hypothetical protein
VGGASFVDGNMSALAKQTGLTTTWFVCRSMSGPLRCVLKVWSGPQALEVLVLHENRPVVAERCENGDEAAVLAERFVGPVRGPALAARFEHRVHTKLGILLEKRHNCFFPAGFYRRSLRNILGQQPACGLPPALQTALAVFLLLKHQRGQLQIQKSHDYDVCCAAISPGTYFRISRAPYQNAAPSSAIDNTVNDREGVEESRSAIGALPTMIDRDRSAAREEKRSRLFATVNMRDSAASTIASTARRGAAVMACREERRDACSLRPTLACSVRRERHRTDLIVVPQSRNTTTRPGRFTE